MQTIGVILLLVIAAALVLRAAYRTLFPGKAGCGGSCGCGNKTAAPPPQENQPARTVFFSSEDLVNRIKARKGS